MHNLLLTALAIHACLWIAVPTHGAPAPQQPTPSALSATVTSSPAWTTQTLPTAPPRLSAPVNQREPSTLVGVLRKSSTGRNVPVMTFGNPTHQGDLAPYFVAIDFGDIRGLVYGTFDLIDNGRKCQFTSMDQTQRAEGFSKGAAPFEEILNSSSGIACPPMDDRTIRDRLSLPNTREPTWTVSASARGWATTTFATTVMIPTVATSHLTPSMVPAWGNPMVANKSSKGDMSVSTMTSILITLGCVGTIVVGFLLKKCARNLEKEGNDSLNSSSARCRPVGSDQEDIPLALTATTTRTNPTQNISSASPFCTQTARDFLAAHPPSHVPTDALTLASMQLSPAQWHLVNPTYTLSTEYKALLSPHMSFHPNQFTFELFPTSIAGRRRPPALSVQTRLPVPLPPPRESLTADSPYAGLHVPRTLYCEFRIITAGKDTCVAIGLARGPYPACALPGAHAWSVAYHSQLGLLHVGTESGSPEAKKHGSSFGVGDVVGVGVDTVERCVYFTVNGRRLERAVEVPSGREAVYPTVGATGRCEIEYNFGTSGFRWNGSGEAGEERCGEREFMGYVMDGLPAYAG